MNIIEIPISELVEAAWNPNQMNEITMMKLRESVSRYGLVEPLVVRRLNENEYEVLSGNQRIKILRDMQIESLKCVVVELDTAKAMLLAQALNSLSGEDDLALKGQLLKEILKSVPETQILSLLPETTKSLKSLSSINELDLAEYLKAWNQAQVARLRHMQLQLTDKQLETVEEAINLMTPKAKENGFDNPNIRGNAVFLLCKFYLDRRDKE